MHFYALVAFPPTDEPAADVVDRLMAPYDEGGCRCYEANENAECTCGAFWDWYQIGGRWTGQLSGYNPSLDPANIETCFQCGGSGKRPGALEQFGQKWIDAVNGCNGCRGLGATSVWPSAYADHPGDIARLGEVRDAIAKQLPYRVLAGEMAYARERWTGDNFAPADDIAAELSRLSDECIVVVVDYHT